VRILHTSDWHLGHNFYNQDRKKEHEQFLAWLLSCLSDNQIDTLIVAGDIFDSAAPPNYALELYYRFIKGLAQTPCKQTIIIGGNHDSAANLQAPKDLLKLFNVHIVGSISRHSLRDDIIVLNNANAPDKPAGIVCAVPFLRERDIRTAISGESYADKSASYQTGIACYYKELLAEAQSLVGELGYSPASLPIITTGHLFTSGSEVSEGVREIAVGSLDGISASVFPGGFDYVALGHLHKAQLVAGKESRRYSGSPLPLSFGEAKFPKQVVIADFHGGNSPEVRTVAVPLFQAIDSVKGSWQDIESYFSTVSNREEAIWLEIVLECDDWGEEVQGRIAALALNTSVQVLAIKRKNRNLLSMQNDEGALPTLAELLPGQVFAELLGQADINDDERCRELRLAHDELLESAWRRWRQDRHED
jgi:exonuclease SbcD